MRKIKALHSVGSLRRGGIETWMMNVIRLKDPRLQVDFILHAKPGESGAYEEEAKALGCKIHYQPPSSWMARRLRAIGLLSADPFLENILRAEKYDVLHVHGTELVGGQLKIAKRAGTPVRVAHCHNTKLARGKTGPEMWMRWIRYLILERRQVAAFATELVACGRDAGRLMSGKKWDNDKRCKVIYCGIQLAAFNSSASMPQRSDFLQRYHLPDNAIVIGHAGSMGPTHQKNHKFIVKVFAELARRSSRYYLFLAGDGPLRSEIIAQINSLGIADRVRMPGSLPDVPAHMTNLFDAHLLPSLLEGLPVVAIEAAAAGLYTVMSENITDEVVNLLPTRIERISLDAPLATWADRVELACSKKESAYLGVSYVKATPLTIEGSVNELVSLYERRLAGLSSEA